MEPCGVVLQQVVDKKSGKTAVGLCLYKEEDNGDETLVLISIIDPEVTHRYKFLVDGEPKVVLKRPRKWWEFWK